MILKWTFFRIILIFLAGGHILALVHDHAAWRRACPLVVAVVVSERAIWWVSACGGSAMWCKLLGLRYNPPFHGLVLIMTGRTLTRRRQRISSFLKEFFSSHFIRLLTHDRLKQGWVDFFCSSSSIWRRMLRERPFDITKSKTSETLFWITRLCVGVRLKRRLPGGSVWADGGLVVPAGINDAHPGAQRHLDGGLMFLGHSFLGLFTIVR